MRWETSRWIHWRSYAGFFDGLQNGRKGIVSEGDHDSDVFLNVLAEDGQDLVENVLLGRQSVWSDTIGRRNRRHPVAESHRYTGSNFAAAP